MHGVVSEAADSPVADPSNPGSADAEPPGPPRAYPARYARAPFVPRKGRMDKPFLQNPRACRHLSFRAKRGIWAPRAMVAGSDSSLRCAPFRMTRVLQCSEAKESAPFAVRKGRGNEGSDTSGYAWGGVGGGRQSRRRSFKSRFSRRRTARAAPRIPRSLRSRPFRPTKGANGQTLPAKS